MKATPQTKFNKIQEILNCLNDISSSQEEFEIRFGQFNKNKFFPKVSLEHFVTANNFLNILCDNRVVQEYSLTINHRDSSRITQILTPPRHGTFSYPWSNSGIIGEKMIKKQNIKNIDDHEYGIRYSLSKEIPLDDISSLCDSVNNPPVFFKTRKRITYFYNHIKFDVSMFKSSDDINNLENSEIHYDIEIEIIDSKLLNPNDMFYVTEQILKIIQQSNIPMKFDEMVKVREHYYTLTNSKKFIGCQPETLTKDKVSRNTEYAVTIKLDGKRHFLFADRGSIFLLDNKLNVVKLDIEAANNISDNFIIDGELLPNGVFHCFDILFSYNKDVRDLDLKERLVILAHFVNTVDNPNVVVKEYFFENLVSKMKNYISDTPVGTDGLILVPVNKSYPQTKNENVPLKWKPEFLNTIDFKIKKVKGATEFEIWELFCSGGHQFEYYGYYGVTRIPIEIALNYSDESVIEFFFDKTSEQFYPCKSRHDKTDGNYIEVAKDNFDTIMEPFDILGYFNNQVISKQSFFDMRRFHNWIKRIMLYEAIQSDPGNKTRKLLDLACGKGGDIHKWVDNNIRYVHGYDINSESIGHATSRYNRVRQKPTSKNFDFKFNCLDLNKNNVPLTSDTFDLVTCFFAIHYFCENKETMTSFLSNFDSLKENGIVLVTTLCSQRLKDINYSYDSENLKITPIDSNRIKVFIKDTVLDRETEEYIVDKDLLINTMKSKGFTLVESKTFDEYYPMWKENDNFLNYKDRNYSFLNRTYVFKKCSNPIKPQAETICLEKMTLVELRKYCKSNNINIETLKTKKSILLHLTTIK
jgi:ubiquinone/menaquinone biosynthesis C-methylase UbiE